MSGQCFATGKRYADDDVVQEECKRSRTVAGEVASFKPFFDEKENLDSQIGRANVTRDDIKALRDHIDLDTFYSPLKVRGAAGETTWHMSKQLTHETDEANLALMQAGLTPFTPGGNKYNAHHLSQDDADDKITITKFTHKTFHTNFHDTNPSTINRSAFASERSRAYKATAARAIRRRKASASPRAIAQKTG